MKTNNKYRHNAINPADLYAAFLMGPNFDNVATLCVAANEVLNREDYLLWMKHWRNAYKAISEQLREMKQDSRNQSALAGVRRIANTLINARQVMIDRHRGRIQRKESV